MTPHARAVLSALNIPVWGTRQAIAPTIAPVAVWRDQPPSASKIVATLDTAPIAAKAQPSIAPVASITPPPAPPQPIPLTRLPVPHEAQPRVDRAPIEAIAAQDLLRFGVEVLQLRSWLLLVPTQSLEDHACRQLWEQLHGVLAGTRVEWFWPLAEGARWQHAPYAAVALQGLLARLHPHARVGLMGELPDQVLPDRVERLPSLAELIEQPLHKRTLWQLLRAELTPS